MNGHETGLIVTIALSFGLALILGFVATKLRLPALVGYLLAGVVIGPATPGIVADVGVASQPVGQSKQIIHIQARMTLATRLARDSQPRLRTDFAERGCGEQSERRRTPAHTRNVAHHSAFDPRRPFVANL